MTTHIAIDPNPVCQADARTLISTVHPPYPVTFYILPGPVPEHPRGPDVVWVIDYIPGTPFTVGPSDEESLTIAAPDIRFLRLAELPPHAKRVSLIDLVGRGLDHLLKAG